eukprot:CAMPEP_0201480538 /NCGR_PEP_ID=MMETSP0151_2-20130828/5009_1 /ASSEMBLY_ACC=CAM_ASM_000257 /TAXON_ID=200890 /ORGANISM="Paramoeba atlantica, Strain 621/1 / CCAP 1560/9" /LENGTH=979 /DNA_ID=CAMNT_0047862429 /DNA_START=38 /DNA_END=2977 /DNA_ORIENTATION=-
MTKPPEVKIDVEFVAFSQDGSQEIFNKLKKEIRSSFGGATLGALMREMKAEKGDFAEGWVSEIMGLFGASEEEKEGKKKGKKLKAVSVVEGMGAVFAIKDESDLSTMKNSAKITSMVFKKLLLAKIETAIDEEQKISHATLADKVEDVVVNSPEKITKVLKDADVDCCYTPIIQSAAPYNLKPSAESNNKNLQFGTIISSVGVRFKRYCTNVCRTLFVNPTPRQKEMYEVVLALQENLISLMKPGAKLSEIFEKMEKAAKNKGVAKFLYPHFGFGIGLEFLERYLNISSSSERTIEEGMVFNIDVGLQNLTTTKNKEETTYSIKISDTVQIMSSEAVLLTNIPRNYSEIAYILDDEEEEVEKPRPSKKERRRKAPVVEIEDEFRPYQTRGTRRGGDQNSEVAKKAEEKSNQIKAHQQLLWEKMRDEAFSRLNSKSKGKTSDKKEALPERLISYSKPQEIPNDLPHNRIFVDYKSDSLLLPIYGDLIPFHISIVKSVTSLHDTLQTDDFELRLNFLAPSVGPGANVNVGQNPTVAANPTKVFLREVTYKMGTDKNLTTVLRQIQELRKRWNHRQAMKKKTEGIVEQAKLIMNSSRDLLRLSNILVRPTLGGRRTTGTLEVHKNGFRFIGGKGQTLDILFRNIQHAFYQPCKNSLITLLHFHLRDAIMIGKKRTNDIQFFVEVIEAVRDVEKDRRSAFDQDEIEEENRERFNRRKWNEKFRKFVQTVENVVDDLSFDSPFDDLAFDGIVDRHNVKMVPTVHALVFLQEPPFFVMTLDDVQVAVFERVEFGLRNFDLTFVFEDWTKKPRRIDSIPIDSIETIQEWLDSCDIKFYVFKTNLNWKHVMERAIADPVEFWTGEGGWEGILGEGGSSDEEEDSGDDSGFEVVDEEETGGNVSSDAYSDDSEFSGSEDEEDVEEDDDEDEELSDVEDWDEMDRRAEEEDRRKFGDRGELLKRKKDEESDSDDDRYKNPKKRRKEGRR